MVSRTFSGLTTPPASGSMARHASLVRSSSCRFIRSTSSSDRKMKLDVFEEAVDEVIDDGDRDEVRSEVDDTSSQ